MTTRVFALRLVARCPLVAQRVRWLLIAILFGGSAGGALPASPGRLESLDALRAARKQAAERPRRVIFNNDGNEPVYLCKTTSPDELLSYRTAPLAGTHVDAIFYCTWSSGFGLFTHHTKVGQVFATREGLFERNLAPAMLTAGTDPLQVMTTFGRKHGIEIFWSFRLNDTHDGSTADYGPIMFRANRLKQEHPEWLIGSPQQKPKHGAWSAVDFTRREIRDLAFRYVEEVCQNYEVDGVEIDFFRHPVFFKRPAQTGTECEDHERGLMSDLLGRIRAMMEREGLRRGRPLLLAVRVPDSIEYCRAIGLDLSRWLAEGWIDLLVTGGYFRLNDYDYSVALGRKYGVKVYPSLDESRVRDVDARKLRSSTAAYRGRALEAWAAGADGVYLFNSFNPKDPIWRELGSAALLAKSPCDYFASVLGPGAAAGGSLPHAAYMKLPRLNPANPLPLKPGGTEQTIVAMGGAPSDRKTLVTLRLQFNRALGTDAVTVSVNGVETPPGSVKDRWLETVLPPGVLRPGANTVAVTRVSGNSALAWTDLHCTVRPEPKPPPLDLQRMIQPLTERNLFRLENYYCWCPQLFRDTTGPYYLVYSRWPKTSQSSGWLTHSEIALAVSDRPDGPFTHRQVLLQGAGPGHWDELMAHNPKLLRFGDKYYLYYISSRAGPSRGHVRDSQRTGVAVADALLGPYHRSAAPIIEPAPPVYNVTVNPAVVAQPDGRYLMMIKGDITPKLPTERMPQRVQGLAIAERPEGPFRLQPELAIRDIDTEDASLWYDAARESYFAVFHAHKYVGLIESADGLNWQRATHYQVTTGNELARADGSVLRTKAPLQRPGVYVENGTPRVLTLAIPDGDQWYCATVTLAAPQ